MARVIDPLLDESEVSRQLNVSVETIRKWRYARTGPAWRKLGPGRNAPVRYSQVDLDHWLDRQAVAS